MVTFSQSQNELVEHLNDHLQFLISSSDAFDAGTSGEAKRLATSLRVLFHDTSRSRSLLGQLRRLGGKFISTTVPPTAGNLSTHGGLMITAISEAESSYYAPLDAGWIVRWLPFDDWWNEVVFIDDQKAELTRKTLVLAVANKDGGAHVDPKLDEVYARLSRHNSLGWVHIPGKKVIQNPERAAIRQISHEALRTLVLGYRKTPKIEADILVSGAVLSEGDQMPNFQTSHTFRRNEPCPCGSGAKYKKCHGALL
jgi:hypothetical protein